MERCLLDFDANFADISKYKLLYKLRFESRFGYAMQ